MSRRIQSRTIGGWLGIPGNKIDFTVYLIAGGVPGKLLRESQARFARCSGPGVAFFAPGELGW